MMTNQELSEIAMYAGVTKMSPDALVRARADALSLTIGHIQQARSLLTTLEADAAAQLRALRTEVERSKR